MTDPDAPLSPFGTPLAPADLRAELAQIEPRGHVVAQAPELPFGLQSPRQFELLTHALLDAEKDEAQFYDRVQIMPEGADEAVDVALRRGSDLVGIVQCKRYATAIGQDLVLTEIFKLLLFALAGGRELPPGCQYQFWTARSLTKQAVAFFADPRAVLQKLTRAEQKDLLGRAKSQAKTLGAMTIDDRLCAGLVEQAQRLDIRHVGPEVLASRLSRHQAVRRLFFRSPGDSEPVLADVAQQFANRRREAMQQSEAEGRSGSAPYIAATGLDDQFQNFMADAATAFVVVGGSGRGKSTWCARLLADPPVGFEADLLFAAHISVDDTDFVATLARLLGGSCDSMGTKEGAARAVRGWLDAANRVIVVDGLDRMSSQARANLLNWFEASVRICRRYAAKLVFTSRPETWEPVAKGLGIDVGAAIFQAQDDPVGSLRGLASFRIGPLTSAEARQLYAAYGLPSELHGRRPLNSPGLIHSFAALRAEVGDGELTRRDVMNHVVGQARAEVLRSGLGRASIDVFLDHYGRLLQESADGQVSNRQLEQSSPNALAVLDEFLKTDLIVALADAVRTEPDEAAEFLGAAHLDIEAALAALPGRLERPLFVGMVAMAVSALEDSAPTRVTDIVRRLLQTSSGGLDLHEVAIRIISELRDQQQFESDIRALLRATPNRGFLLLRSNLYDLIQDLRLPADLRLDLLFELEDREDDDDWRPKFWTDPEASGRFMTPFARAATTAVRAEPVAAINLLIARYERPDANAAVLRGLTVEAGLAAPDAAFQALWSRRSTPAGRALRDVAYMRPQAAARHIIELAGDGTPIPPDVPEFLWELAGHYRREGDSDVSATDLLAAAAKAWLSRASYPRDQALLLLTMSLSCPLTSGEQDRLAALWPHVGVHEVWSLIDVCPVHSEALLDRLFAEAGEISTHGQALRFLNQRLDWDPLVSRLATAVQVGEPSALPPVADAVENLLYRDEIRDQRDPRLGVMARTLAASPDSTARRAILYFAGSPTRFETPTPEQIAFRDELVEILVAHEDGDTLDTLVWKLGESATERGHAAERLLLLCRKFGTATVAEHLEIPFITLGGQKLREDLQRLLEDEGLPALPEEHE